MKKIISLMSLSMTMILIATSNSFSQKCTKESAEPIENGYPQIKYCIEDLGWRESVKKNEWRVRVFNLYEDMEVSMEFTLIENGADAKEFSSYSITPKGGYQGYSFYFSSEPEFVYRNIKLIEIEKKPAKEEDKTNPLEKPVEVKATTPDDIYTWKFFVIGANCSLENATFMDSRYPEMKCCIKDEGEHRTTGLIKYRVTIYNTSGNDFISVDVGLGLTKNFDAKVRMEHQGNIPPENTSTAVFLYPKGSIPQMLFFRNVEVTNFMQKTPRIKF